MKLIPNKEPPQACMKILFTIISKSGKFCDNQTQNISPSKNFNGNFYHPYKFTSGAVRNGLLLKIYTPAPIKYELGRP